jgi:hypothetical protein
VSIDKWILRRARDRCLRAPKPTLMIGGSKHKQSLRKNPVNDAQDHHNSPLVETQ